MPYHGSFKMQNVVDAKIIKKLAQIDFGYSCSVPLIYFLLLSDHKLYQTLSNNHYSGSSKSYSTNTCSILKPPKNLSNLFKDFNNFSSQQKKTLKISLTVSIMTLKKFEVLII